MANSLPSRWDSQSDRVVDKGASNRQFVQVGNDLRFLRHASAVTSRNTDPGRMLDEILELIFDWIAADRGCILLQEKQQSSMQIKCFKCRAAIGDRKFRVSKSILDYVKENKVGVLSAKASSDHRWGEQPSLLGMETDEMLCVPIQGRNQLLGMIYLDTLGEGIALDEVPRFNEDHLKLLVAIAHQAAVAIENATFYATLLEKERAAAVGETTALIAHQVKNMLQGINGGAHLVESGLKSKNLETVGTGWGIVNRNQEKISRLMMDMLTLAQPLVPNLAAADINLIIEEAASRLAEDISIQGMNFTFNPCPNLKPVEIDREGITLAMVHIINLSLLACRSCDPGNTVTRVRIRDNQLVIVTMNDGKRIEINQTNDILDPFGFSDDQKTYGIGLAVCRKIVAAHHGRLLLSYPGEQGNRIVVELPLSLADR